MTDHNTYTGRETNERGVVNHFAFCSCGWERWAPDETTAREYARKHRPRPGKGEG